MIRQYLLPDDFFICCDSGLDHYERLGIVPDLVIGDFDSHEKPDLPAITIVLHCEKDDTDTMAAVREAMKRGFRDFLLIGIIGGRIDHTFANLYILLWLDNRGLKALAADDHSEMEIVSRFPAHVDDRFSFFSLVNISGKAAGINVKTRNIRWKTPRSIVNSRSA